MMGTKVRLFGPLKHVSLEDLVPKDHFYRQAGKLIRDDRPGNVGGA